MTAPLTAEVVAQMIGALYSRAADRGSCAKTAYTIRDMDSMIKAADMLTALATHLAERDAECREAVMQSLASMGQAQEAHEAQVEAEAELARVTAQRDALVKIDVARDGEHRDALARIAALTEALAFYADKTCWNQPPVKTRDGLISVEYENQASKMQRDRGTIARAALTTDKEPTT